MRLIDHRPKVPSTATHTRPVGPHTIQAMNAMNSAEPPIRIHVCSVILLSRLRWMSGLSSGCLIGLGFTAERGNLADQCCKRFLCFRFLRDGPADIAGGESDPGGQNAVDGTFSEARRQSPDNAFADNVLNEAVGQGESPRDGEMAYDHSSEPECRERRRSAAIEGRDFPQHPQILDS